MSQRLLEGNFEEVPIPADDVIRLRREMAGLEQELAEAKQALKVERQASNDAKKAVAALRKMTEPFHIALQMIHGEIDRVNGAAFAVGTDFADFVSSRDPRWDSWKKKLPPKEWDFIEAILEHGAMTRQQMAAAIHCHVDTASTIANRLKNKQLIRKDGDKYALRSD
jgi:hypothetical protein